MVSRSISKGLRMQWKSSDLLPESPLSGCAADTSHYAAEPRDLDLLMRDLNDPSEDVRRTAAASLLALGSDALPACRALIAALDDSDPTVRRLAVETLGMLGPPAGSACEALVELHNRDGDQLGSEVGWALNRIVPGIVQPLL